MNFCFSIFRHSDSELARHYYYHAGDDGKPIDFFSKHQYYNYMI